MVHMDLRPGCQGSVLGLLVTHCTALGRLFNLSISQIFFSGHTVIPAWLEHCEDRCQRSKDGICNVNNFG